MTLPRSVGTFVWYIVDEAHENSANEKHKYVSDHNPIYLPTNLVIPQGTAITFLDADAPWDTPHPHSIPTLSIRLEGLYIAQEKWIIQIVQCQRFYHMGIVLRTRH